ncbi:hypothetical protein Stube_28440 [Streptomyces tubercidicus]|uniref:Uncharacterized protein n=1 Tax=Streptomyces tubercidicus TaxID=47759 RepID=A0A640UTZ2_9ACTN|nr:hypothetical protein Stube_28440 [Streptomyces tubercidicus]
MVSTARDHSCVHMRMHAQMHVHDTGCRARHSSSSTVTGPSQTVDHRPPPPDAIARHLVRIDRAGALGPEGKTCATPSGFRIRALRPPGTRAPRIGPPPDKRRRPPTRRT